MKKVLVAFMLVCSVSAFAKEYTEVVQVPDKNTDQLYSLAREWFAETFKSAQDVLQMDDPVAGKLIGKGMGDVNVKSGMVPVTLDYEFQVKVFVKDGRYKYLIEKIAIVSDGVRSSIEEFEQAREKFKNKKKKVAYFSSIIDSIDDDMKKLIISLNSKMKGIEDDW